VQNFWKGLETLTCLDESLNIPKHVDGF